MRALCVANICYRRATELRRARHSPPCHRQLTHAVRRISHNRRQVIGENAGQRRQVTGGVTHRAGERDNRGLPLCYIVEVAARPVVISFALGDPGDLVRQAHDIGAKVMVQVTTVAQAIEAAERGVDVVIAQGGEAGGYGGSVSTMTLVPQVVDAVSPIPVVAAGGIYDGRGIAAALMLGAVGVNLGTRFLASKEAPIADEWKHAIAGARSEDAVKVDVLNDIRPLPGTVGYGTVLRSLHTPFIDEWSTKREEARREREHLWADITARAQAGRRHETFLTAGQTAGGIREILPVAEIMRQLIAETTVALSRAPNQN
jgi:enoyl-[acyl-carrier protein] reductase II